MHKDTGPLKNNQGKVVILIKPKQNKKKLKLNETKRMMDEWMNLF